MINLNLFVLVLFVPFTHSCKCLPKSFHEAYCQSDFVISGKVATGMRMSVGNIYLQDFVLETHKVFFQKTEIFKEGQTTVVLTPRALDLCSADLIKNKHYLLGGSIKRNTVYVTSCGLIKEWSLLPKHLKKAMRKGKLSCACMVTGCNSEICSRDIGGLFQPNQCQLGTSRACYEENGVCTLNNGTCEWTKLSKKKVLTCLNKAVNFNER
ncbi:metalloproteinase inhibitor 3 [Hydra vulgaris]|uniref:metalloproteinase inhibitor 3 n=1 Tax=Hydra vulgaris TaxID=6087 RepID=UPI00019258E1|nr:metalloproteinase inhibitor 3 [Hydra vulgaris]